MLEKRIESRAALYRTGSVLYPAFPPTPGEFPPIVDRRTMELADLFQQEEDLAHIITDDKQEVAKAVVLKAIAIAKKLAEKGLPTVLVPLDEMLDIQRLYSCGDPNTSAVVQSVLHTHLHTPSKTETMRQFYVFRNCLPTHPDQDLANTLLTQLTESLDDEHNSTWTARVAAALAYLSEVS